MEDKLYHAFIDAMITIVTMLLALFVYDNLNIITIRNEKQIYQNQKDDTAAKANKLAEIIWCENRASLKSMHLVMSVIYNRAKEKTLDGLYKEATKHKQFSCFNNPNFMQSQTMGQRDKEMLYLAEQLVWNFMTGDFRPSISAKFYYAPKKVNKPKYLEDKKLLLVFEGHNYYY